MDRDATSPSPSSDAALAAVVPPFEWPTVRKVAVAGTGMIAAAAVLGLIATAIDSPIPAIHTARLFLVLIGSITVGSAVSMRPDLWQVWGVATGASLLAIAGTPAHWDSFRLLFGAITAISLTWTVMRAAPSAYRLPVVSCVLLFHFTGIFFATTTPPTGPYPTPWVSEQAFMRIFNPYLQFLYLRNAYHFYSPEPGPASVLVFLLRTETGTNPTTGEKQYATKWVVVPKRPADIRDPLGLTYYRRLSLTEQVSRSSPISLRGGAYEAREILGRRQLTPIPMHPTDEQEYQFLMPQPEIARFVLPSYASHIILEHTPNKEVAAKTTVKVYRMRHNTMQVDDFINWRKRSDASTSPYNPLTYRPYFLGEFDAFGNLVNPQEPMLYWLVPILPRQGGVPPGETTKRVFLDYMSFHALGPEGLGPETTVDDLGDPKFKGRVFDWGQLR